MSDAAIDHDPRCIDCGYVLTGLTESRCPECARPFDLNDSRSFTYKPPLVRWRLWLPGIVMALATGVAGFGVGLAFGTIATGVSLATPIAIGALTAYHVRLSPIVRAKLTLATFLSTLLILLLLSMVGLLCVVIAFLALVVWVAIGFCFGAIFGWALREHLKASKFSQRAHLPLLATLMIIPVAWSGIDAAFPNGGAAPEQVTTRRRLPATPTEVWRSIALYEDLQAAPPLLLRLGPRPIGRSAPNPFDPTLQICRYQQGSVIKRVEENLPDKRFAFRVISHSIGEEHSVRLLSGRFDLTPATANATDVAVTTVYEPKLHPRFVWRPFERWTLHTLHNFLLDEMGKELP